MQLGIIRIFDRMCPMKRILFIAMNLNSGGAERQMVSLACALKKHGHDVNVLCYARGDFFLPDLESNGIEVTWLINDKTLHRLFSVRRFIRNRQFDAVISFLETPNILNIFSSFGRRSWKVITGERSSKFENLLSFRGRIIAYMQRYSDAIVCNSENAADMWRHYYPGLEEKISVIYNMVNVPNGNCLEMNNNVSNNAIRLVVAASYQALKNPVNVIKAISLLDDEEKRRFSLDWFGNADVNLSVYEECVRLVMELKLNDIVHLNGPTKQIYQEIASADYVGLFSNVEGLPNAICEAMAMGKPIIMTKVSDFSKLVDGNGFLCDADDVISIRNIFKNILSITDAQRKTMGEISRKLAVQLFDRDVIIDKWQSLIMK